MQLEMIGMMLCCIEIKEPGPPVACGMHKYIHTDIHTYVYIHVYVPAPFV